MTNPAFGEPALATLPSIPTTATGIFIYAIGLLILWVIISIPVYLAGKLITRGNSDFLDAMGATLGGGLAYFLVYFAVSYFLGAVIGDSATIFGVVIAVLFWIAIYKVAFRTTYIKAVAIVVLSWLILIVLDLVLVQTLGVRVPNFVPFNL
jgi:hypothetical protein